MSWTEALNRGLLKPGDPRIPSDANHSIAVPPPNKAASPGTAKRGSSPSPEQRLAAAVQERYPTALTGFRCLPPRRFTLDVAIPELKVAIECDGWEFHGRFKRDFHRDREKRNALELDGWVVLAFSARDILQNLPALMEQVDRAVHQQLKLTAPPDFR